MALTLQVMLRQQLKHLLRSRYTAYSLNNKTYLSETLDTKSRLKEDFESEEVLKTDLKWVGLEILNTSEGGVEDETGTVEFLAKYKAEGNFEVHHERSNFRRESGRWVCVGVRLILDKISVSLKK